MTRAARRWAVVVLLLVAGCTGRGPLDFDGDGVIDAEDCAPRDATISPDEPEVCDDAIDNDCDVAVDDEDPDCCEDVDGDGFGAGCPAGADCDDADAALVPGAAERCHDEVDNDCDGAVDMDDLDCCLDVDGDGFGAGCPAGGDCDDADGGSHPGAADPFGDGADTDCDGVDGEDADGDAYPGNAPETAPEHDCDDGDGAIHPGAEEVCGDLVDEDCDGQARLPDEPAESSAWAWDEYEVLPELEHNLGPPCPVDTEVCGSAPLGFVMCQSHVRADGRFAMARDAFDSYRVRFSGATYLMAEASCLPRFVVYNDGSSDLDVELWEEFEEGAPPSEWGWVWGAPVPADSGPVPLPAPISGFSPDVRTLVLVVLSNGVFDCSDEVTYRVDWVGG